MIVRRIPVTDRDLVRSHLTRLAPHDRTMRFCGPASDDWIHGYIAQSERCRIETIGCFIDGRLRAAADLILPTALDRSAEVALSVEGPYQGRGLGGTVLKAALLHARNRLIGAVSFVTLAANTRMRRLARRNGATLCASDGMLEGRFLLPWPSQLSIAREFADESLAFMDRLFPAPGGEQQQSPSRSDRRLTEAREAARGGARTR